MRPGYIPVVLRCASGLYWDAAQMKWAASFSHATKFPTARAAMEYANEAIAAGIAAFHEVGGINFILITNPPKEVP